MLCAWQYSHSIAALRLETQNAWTPSTPRLWGCGVRLSSEHSCNKFPRALQDYPASLCPQGKRSQFVRHLSVEECGCCHWGRRLDAQQPVCIACAGHCLQGSSEGKLSCSAKWSPPCVIHTKQKVPLIHTFSCHRVTSVCRDAPSSHHGGVRVARRCGCLAVPTSIVVPYQCPEAGMSHLLPKPGWALLGERAKWHSSWGCQTYGVLHVWAL